MLTKLHIVYRKYHSKCRLHHAVRTNNIILHAETTPYSPHQQHHSTHRDYTIQPAPTASFYTPRLHHTVRTNNIILHTETTPYSPHQQHHSTRRDHTIPYAPTISF
ncbi:hypothetical protein PoB_002459200 [Plakobranchus ocellatus]|uniref:Uncharacterized protein n=1 Tax=Plakobranchus ocellatus TaxID=259542 RepID=A0AAV3ZSG3_9GAST|nr:hypothetical protein PoB_002459200 [Plakobranchus ocellatus]